MSDHDNPHPMTEHLLGHRPQSEYVIRYPAHPTVVDGVHIVFHVTMALTHHRPLYFLVHHTATLPAGFRSIATAIESYGSDGDTEETAAERLLRRIERDRSQRS